MGADGHIKIYDYEKIEHAFDTRVINDFFDHFGSSVLYKQTLHGRKYLTRYWGDNIDYYDMWDVVHSCYDPGTDTMRTGVYSYDSYSGEYFMKLSKDKRVQFLNIIKFIEEQCQLTSWEVWT